MITTTNAADPVARRAPTWPLWLLAAPAGVAIWSGWVGLGGLTGFGVVRPLPGIWDGLELNTAVTLPIGVEAYAAYAIRAWLAPGVPERARRFARASAIGALVLGALGQVVFHLMVAAEVTAAPWPITAAVACLPVAVLGMGAGLAHLLHGDAGEDSGRREAGEAGEVAGEVAGLSKADAVRAAVTALGKEAEPAAVVAWLQARGVVVAPSYVSDVSRRDRGKQITGTADLRVAS